MLPPVGTIGVITPGSNPLQVLVKGGISVLGHLQVSREDVEQQAVVSRTLHIGFAPQGIDATPSDPDVTQEKL